MQQVKVVNIHYCGKKKSLHQVCTCDLSTSPSYLIGIGGNGAKCTKTGRIPSTSLPQSCKGMAISATNVLK